GQDSPILIKPFRVESPAVRGSPWKQRQLVDPSIAIWQKGNPDATDGDCLLLSRLSHGSSSLCLNAFPGSHERLSLLGEFCLTFEFSGRQRRSAGTKSYVTCSSPSFSPEFGLDMRPASAANCFSASCAQGRLLT